MPERLQERLFVLLTGSATAIGVGLIGGIFLLLLAKGLRVFTLRFLLEPTIGFGATGGVFYQLIGTGILTVGAAAVSIPLAGATALLLTEYLLHPTLRKGGETILFMLNGVPSIIFGLFGYIVFVEYFGFGVSWSTGAVILGLMILPTLTVGLAEAIDSIPRDRRDAARSLGLTATQVIWRLVLPGSVRGLITGLLLGLGRAAGETAPIMFTATVFSGAAIPGSFFEPVVALPTHILALAQEASDPATLQNAWGAALLLVLWVGMMNIAAFWARRRVAI